MSEGRLGRRLKRLWAESKDGLAGLRYRWGGDALGFVVQTIKELPAQADAGRRRLVLFAHFDRKDEVDPYVVFYLEALCRAGSTIVFVSGSPQLQAETAEAIRPFCAGIYTRETLSLDFGSWHLAWALVEARGWKLESFDELLLANDSVYGPLFDLEEMSAKRQGADLYGVVESKEHVSHLQSFFLLWALNERTLPFLREFWRNFQYVADKDKLIQRYEIGMSVAAREQGFAVKAYIPDEAARAVELEAGDGRAALYRGQAVNNMLTFWDTLIAANRCPFLKTSLLVKARPEGIERVPKLLRQYTAYDPRLVEEHVRRITR